MADGADLDEMQGLTGELPPELEAAGQAVLPHSDVFEQTTQTHDEQANLPYTPGQCMEAMIGGIQFDLIADYAVFPGETSGFAGHASGSYAQPPFLPNYLNLYENTGMMQRDLNMAGSSLEPLPPSMDYQASINTASMQFNEEPRLAIDGKWVRSFLRGQEDLSKDMSWAVVRMLRLHNQPSGERDGCHYVGYTWADSHMRDEGNNTQRMKLFTKPEIVMPLHQCNKVAALLLTEDEKWASLSIDLAEGVTNLIHPALSTKSEEYVLATHLPLCKLLTQAVVNHMASFFQAKPMSEWIYKVPLASRGKLPRKWTGITAAFYSVPKHNQFIPVSKETIAEKKRILIHNLVKECHAVTGKTVKMHIVKLRRV